MEKCKTCNKINECDFDLTEGKECNEMTIVFMFKNGEKLKVECEDCSITTNAMGNLTGYEMTGIIESKPLYIDMNSVQCIYRV